MPLKFRALCFLIAVSGSLFAQVESTELFPDIVNTTSGLVNSRPSMSEDQNRLCFTQVNKKTKVKTIMVSDKAINGLWSQPYAAFEFKKAEFSISISMSANGGQIDFDKKDDI